MSLRVVHAGNYLRVRGEYFRVGYLRIGVEELPPRTRRILEGFTHVFDTCGTTSAYAENTLEFWDNPFVFRNYLRVRGEYASGGLF